MGVWRSVHAVELQRGLSAPGCILNLFSVILPRISRDQIKVAFNVPLFRDLGDVPDDCALRASLPLVASGIGASDTYPTTIVIADPKRELSSSVYRPDDNNPSLCAKELHFAP